MAYLTESRLLNAYMRLDESITSMHKSFSARILPDANIFLSHSHLDRKLIQGFIQELKQIGASVYVDWNDSEMPNHTNRETAKKIKERIVQNDLFMVFATANAMESRWVPWEIGVADQAKSYDEIFIIPVARDGTAFSGNEYLQLYNSILLSDTYQLVAFRPRQNTGGLLLKSLIERKGYY